MLHIYCDTCGWNQDDFWDKDYNPLKLLYNWEETLLDFDKLDTKSVGGRTYREIIVDSCLEAARVIKDMTFLRPEDIIENIKCPECGNNRIVLGRLTGGFK